MTAAAHRAVGETPGGAAAGLVRIELANRAGNAARISHSLARATLRPAVSTAAALAWRGPFRGSPAFRVANFAELAAVGLVAPRGTRRRAEAFPNFRAEWLWHNSIPEPRPSGPGVILYFHGGGFVFGGLHSHRRLVARIAKASGMALLNVDYRQLPKAHYTETVDDALTAYQYLIDEGFPSERIVLAGDSAGGGLTFATALAARDRGLPQPAGIAAISPWSDLDPTRRGAHPNNKTDAMLSAFALSVPALVGFARNGALDPMWSPVNRDFAGLPPVFIQVGAQEVLLSDASLLADRCSEAGIACTVQIWDKAVHVFHAGADFLPDARAAIRELAAFNRRVVSGATTTAARPVTRTARHKCRRRAAVIPPPEYRSADTITSAGQSRVRTEGETHVSTVDQSSGNCGGGRGTVARNVDAGGGMAHSDHYAAAALHQPGTQCGLPR